MRAVLMVIALAGSACAQTQDPRAFVGNDRLSEEGLGRIRIGESIAPVEAALGGQLTQTERVEQSPGCGEWSVRLGESGFISILTQDDIVTRISVHGSTGVMTAGNAIAGGGIGVGDTVERVLAAYPNAERDSAEYTPAPGHELFVWTDPENYVGLRFEIGEDEHVTAIHAGSDLRNDEGCMTT